MAPVRMGSIAAQRRTAVLAQAASPGGKEVVIIGQGWAGEVVDFWVVCYLTCSTCNQPSSAWQSQLHRCVHEWSKHRK